jgi:hypothetical protein
MKEIREGVTRSFWGRKIEEIGEESQKKEEGGDNGETKTVEKPRITRI